MKKLKLFIFLGLFSVLFLIMSCSSFTENKEVENTYTPVANMLTPPYKISVFTLTPSPSPSQTRTPTSTVTYTSTAYPKPQEFDASRIVSITPGIPAQCPAPDTSIEIDMDSFFDVVAYDDENHFLAHVYIDSFLNYLNQGVPLNLLVNTITGQTLNRTIETFHTADVTGDGIDEFIFNKYGETIVYGCKNQEYQLLDTLRFDEFGSDFPPQARFLDTNNNGLLEVVVTNTGCMGGKCFEVAIYEWDGNQFNDLLGWECTNTITTPDDFNIEDIDNNGTLEVIFKFGTWVYMRDFINYPLREETLICMWDGEAFYPAENDFTPLIYRFQALRDGDRQLELGHYERAIEFFNMAINDETLEWYTEERRKVESDEYIHKMYGIDDPNPTATPVLFADPDEYPILASISYYRLVMIYLLLDDLPAAENTYTKMESAFPSDSIGKHFTHMANLLLESYRETADMHQACSPVLDYATENSTEINEQWMYFGWARWVYPGNKICPY